jgi:hypothetical protein
VKLAISEPKVVNGATKVRREWVKEAIAATMLSMVQWKVVNSVRIRASAGTKVVIFRRSS